VDHPLALLPLGLVMVALAQLTGSWPNFYRLRWLFILLIFFTDAGVDGFLSEGAALDKHSHHPFEPRVAGLRIWPRVEARRTARNLGAVSVNHQGRRVHAGLQRLGVPYRVGFAITLSFRLVPLFIDSALTVVQGAELARLRLQSGWSAGAREALRAGRDSGVHGALRKANNMAMALEARGFGVSADADELHRLSDSCAAIASRSQR